MPPVKVGQVLTLNITGITHAAEGVGKYQGYTIFVPDALPGDEVEAMVISTQKQYGRALLARILKPSSDRVTPLCSYYAECGGCQIMHASYAAQLRYKEEQVTAALSRLGGLSGVPIRPIIGMTEPYGYRNKALFPVGVQEGRLVAGYFRRRSHSIVDIDHCLIEHPAISAALVAAKRLAQKYKLPVYDETKTEGLLRHILVRHAFATGETMVVFVINGTTLPQGELIASELMAELPQVVSVQININGARGNIILGSETKLLRGRDHLIEHLAGLKFKVSANSFFQVNPSQTELLYSKAVEFAGCSSSSHTYDLYCGVGTMALIMAKSAGQVTGIEVVAKAVEDAIANAQLNNINNAIFLTGAAEDILPVTIAQGERPDTIVIDPPRAGCDEKLLQTLVTAAPARLVYVSCNPATLARDLKFLTAHGFTVEEVQPVDMFPHTAHVETVVLLTRVKVNTMF